MIAFAARAAALVAAADPAAVAAVVVYFPEAEEIGLRDDPASFNPHRKPPPEDPAKRAEYLRVNGCQKSPRDHAQHTGYPLRRPTLPVWGIGRRRG